MLHYYKDKARERETTLACDYKEKVNEAKYVSSFMGCEMSHIYYTDSSRESTLVCTYKEKMNKAIDITKTVQEKERAPWFVDTKRKLIRLKMSAASWEVR